MMQRRPLNLMGTSTDWNQQKIISLECRTYGYYGNPAEILWPERRNYGEPKRGAPLRPLIVNK